MIVNWKSTLNFAPRFETQVAVSRAMPAVIETNVINIKTIQRMNAIPIDYSRVQRFANNARKTSLSFDEYISLMEADCLDDELKEAAILAANTGLRYEQIRNLRTSDLKNLNLPECLEKRYASKEIDSAPLFPNLPHYSWIETPLRQWARAAKIRHNITFHGFSCAFYLFKEMNNNQSLIINSIHNE